MKNSWITTSVFGVAFGLSAMATHAAPVTFYDYAQGTSAEFGPNVGNAYENHYWGQNSGYAYDAGPIAGGTTDTPYAWSIWKLEAPSGQEINSFSVSTKAQFEFANSDYNNDHVRIEWSDSPTGSWTEIYHHAWTDDSGITSNKKFSYNTVSGTVDLSTPATTIYVRLVADKLAWNMPYTSGTENLRFLDFKVTGDVSPIPEPSGALLLGSAGMGWLLSIRRR